MLPLAAVACYVGVTQASRKLRRGRRPSGGLGAVRAGMSADDEAVAAGSS